MILEKEQTVQEPETLLADGSMSEGNLSCNIYNTIWYE